MSDLTPELLGDADREVARQLTRIARKIRRKACDSESCSHGSCHGYIEAARIVRAERSRILHPDLEDARPHFTLCTTCHRDLHAPEVTALPGGICADCAEAVA